jgi:hypothetical protein
MTMLLQRLILAGLALALLTAPAAAQMPAPSFPLQKEPKQLTPEERAKQKAIDDAYRAALPKIKEKQGPSDPWAGVRPDPAPPSRRSSN